MQDPDDLTLLRDYATRNSEAAFAELVSRRVGFVYAAALRQVRDPHRAEEITQAVFTILAQKAEKISDQTILAGWLFKTTRYAAIAQTRELAKQSVRLAAIEQELQMHSEIHSAAPDPLWEKMSPLLDEALATLGETDRQAVLLRFFENKSLAEVGGALGTGEDTARKRVSRALEKLHKFFNRRGLSSTTAIIAGTLTANSVHAAPPALAKTVTAVALAKGAAASGSVVTLIKGAMKIMVWTKAKMAVAVSVGVLLVAGTAMVVVEKTTHPKLSEKDFSWADNPKYWESNSQVLAKVPPTFILRLTRFPQTGGGVQMGQRMMCKNTRVGQLIDTAYGFSWPRTVFPKDMPSETYDLMLTIPQDPYAKLKQEIAKRFGYTAHSEQRITDVLLLKVKTPNASGLRPTQLKNGNSFWSSSDTETIIQNRPIDSIRSQCESICKLPVLDRTGLKGGYDITLRGRMNSRSEYERLIGDQLGLELVPSREPIEMLVVEKVK